MVRTPGSLLPNLLECLKAAGVVGAWTQDAATQRVVADPNVAQLFGITHPDFANGDPFERYAAAVHPADHAGFQAEIAAASRHGAPIVLQYRVRTSGGVRWVHDYGTFMLDDVGQPLRGQGIVIDATQGRREVEAVKEIAAQAPADARLHENVDLLAEHVIAASEIARALPSTRLRALTDPLLWEVGRLLAWVTAKRR